MPDLTWGPSTAAAAASSSSPAEGDPALHPIYPGMVFAHTAAVAQQEEDLLTESHRHPSMDCYGSMPNNGAVTNNSNYGGDALWRTNTPNRHAYAHAPNDSGLDRSSAGTDNGGNPFSVSSLDLEPLSNIFSFASYKDYPVFKEKGSHDVIADALLSLKHAVVHPSQMSGQLSPLSPGLSHLSQSMASGVGYRSDVGPPPTFPYNAPPGGGQSHGGYSTSLSGQGHHYPQYPDTPPPGQCSPNSCQNNLFPSMSVNVSMSMNVGLPRGADREGMPVVEQWGGHSHPHSHPHPHPHQHPHPHPHPHPHQGMSTSHGQFPSTPHVNGLSGNTHAQYNGYASPPGPSYHASYSFSSDLRSPPALSTKERPFYRSAPTGEGYKGMSKFYGLNALNIRRQKPVVGRAPTSDNGKVNLCRICGKTYARPSTLKTHMRTHSGEKPYRCSTCNKSFSQAANLTAHIRTHSGEKPFRCPVCDRRFSQSSSVTTHMRTHSGERPYGCRMCKKAFSDSSTLTKHLRIHSGEKPYQCKLCLLRFSQSGNLNRHMRVHTNSS